MSFFLKQLLGSESILLRPLPSPYGVSHADFFVKTLATEVRTSGCGSVFAIEKNEDFVGCIDVKRTEWLNGTCEIGYWSVPEFRGLGYV